MNNSSEAFLVGDVVQLKSGGPWQVVSGVRKGEQGGEIRVLREGLIYSEGEAFALLSHGAWLPAACFRRPLAPETVTVSQMLEAAPCLQWRKCADCGNIGVHVDNVLPWVACRKCGSSDTRQLVEHTRQLVEHANG